MSSENEEKENKLEGKVVKKRGILLSVGVVVLSGIGIAGFLLANHKDTKAMESGMDQVLVQDTNKDEASNQTNNVIATIEDSTESAKTTELWLDQHKLTITSSIPTDVTISPMDAAKLGLDNIANDTKQVDNDCEIEMYHMNTVGAVSASGIWVGTTVVNDTNRYEFHINDKTGEVIKRDDYIAGESINSWKKVNSTATAYQEAIIDVKDLAPFSNIDASQINVADCEIIEGDHYGLYIKYNDEQQTASYEEKQGTLIVKIEHRQDVNNNRVQSKMTITVPKGTSFDSITFNSYVGGFSIAKFNVDQLNIKASCGDIDMNGTSYQLADIDAECGNATFNQCTMNHTILNAFCGNVTIRDSKMEDTSIMASCGNIDGLNIVSNDLTAKASCGNVKIIGDITGTINIKDSMGNVTLGCTQDKSQYSYDVSTNVGSAYVDEEKLKDDQSKLDNALAANSIQVATETGNCGIYFKVDPATDITVNDSYDYDDFDYDDFDFDSFEFDDDDFKFDFGW